MIGIYINGAYDILGIVIFKKLYGVVTKTTYPLFYKKYKYVELPMYHLPTDKKPQFIKKLTLI